MKDDTLMKHDTLMKDSLSHEGVDVTQDVTQGIIQDIIGNVVDIIVIIQDIIVIIVDITVDITVGILVIIEVVYNTQIILGKIFLFFGAKRNFPKILPYSGPIQCKALRRRTLRETVGLEGGVSSLGSKG